MPAPRAESIRAEFADPVDAQAFARYTAEAYGYVAVDRGGERTVRLDLPDSHYRRLPYELHEVAARFGADTIRWRPVEAMPETYREAWR